MNENIESMMKKLRLSGMKESIDLRLNQARGGNLDYEEFLELILADEMSVRNSRMIKRRIKSANISGNKTLEQFNWSFNHNISRSQIYDLAACDFIREGKDVLFLGPPGVGKTHLSQAIALRAIKNGFTVYYRSIFDLVRDFRRDEAVNDEKDIIKRYLKPDLLIIDDMGLKQMPGKSGEYLFEVIMRRYEIRSTIMTSNRPIEEWGQLIGDVPATTAILDRFLHHSEIISITGKSYRINEKSLQNNENNIE